MPPIVDRIYVVDDKSRDETAARATETAARDPRIRVVVHEHNGGVGRAIMTGYRLALDDKIDLVAVMAGDNQMNPDELQGLARPVAVGECDYAKANRLTTGEAFNQIPKVRYFGNAMLSMLTKIASGYWNVADSQTGYTVISRAALATLPLDRIYPRYGYPNDLLVHLNADRRVVRDIPSRPVYGVGEKSGIRLWKVIPTISLLLFRRFWWRIWTRYVVRDFHPLVFFYVFGVVLTVTGLGLGVYSVIERFYGPPPSSATAVLIALLVISGFQSLLWAMWFDQDENRRRD